MPYDVVLIVVDALRRDSLGVYDPAYRFTPRLDDRLRDWHRFDRCYASAPWTLPAMTSLLSGVEASRHGRFTHAPDGFDATRLLPAGAFKVGIVNNRNLEPGPLGFHRRFDSYRLVDETDGVAPFAEAHAAINRHRASSEKPLCLLLHTNLVHDYPYARSRPHYEACFPERDDWFDLGNRYLTWRGLSTDERRQMRLRYDACVARLDVEVDRLLGVIDLETTVVCVTADHGEGFDFELGRVHHAGRLHDDLINVPLVMHVPSSAPGERGRLIAAARKQPLAATDVLPTLLDLAGHPNADDRDGRSVVSPSAARRSVITSEERRYLYVPSRDRLNVNRSGKGMGVRERAFNALVRATAARDHAVRAFIEGDFKLIVTSFAPRAPDAWLTRDAVRRLAPTGSTLVRTADAFLALELFDLRNDPGERRNLLAGRQRSAVAAVAADRLPSFDDLAVRVAGRETSLRDALVRGVDGSAVALAE